MQLNILENEAGKGKTKCSGDGHHGALGLGSFVPFGRPDAFKLPFRKPKLLAHTLAERSCQGTAIDFPKLGDTHLQRVHLPSSPHGGEECGVRRVEGKENQVEFVLYAVDGIYYVIETFDMEILSRVGRKARLKGNDFRLGIDVEQAFTEYFDFGSADGGIERRQLTVDVRGVDTVGVDHCQTPDATTHQRLGAPAADASHTEDDNLSRGNMPHSIVTDQLASAFESRVRESVHHSYLLTT